MDLKCVTSREAFDPFINYKACFVLLHNRCGMLHFTLLKEPSVLADKSVWSPALILYVTAQRNRTIIVSALAAGTPLGATSHCFKKAS